MVARNRILLSLVMTLICCAPMLAKEFYSFPQTDEVQDRDIYLLRRPAESGFDNNTGTRNITGAAFKAAFRDTSTAARFSRYTGIGRVVDTDPRLSDSRVPTAHDQAISTITGLQTALDAKANTGDLAAANISYTNPTYTTVGAALDQLLYVAPSITSFTSRISYGTAAPYNQTVSSTASSQTVETGVTVSRVELFWALNKTVTTQSIAYTGGSIGSIDPALRTYDHTGQSATSTRTYTLTVGDGTSTDNTPTNAISFYRRNHWSASAIPLASFTSADILAMASNEFASSHSKSVTYDCTGGRYPTFAFPASYGTLNATTVGGLAFSDYSYRTISHTNASGSTVNYYVYQFNSIQTGAAIAVVWN